MSAPSAEIPCCSPATTESVAVVRDKIADSRADILVGQGQILKGQGDYTSAILRDANVNSLAVNDNVNRTAVASMSQTDKYGLAGLNTTRDENGKVLAAVDRSSYGLSQELHSEGDKITNQATTVAWAHDGNDAHRYESLRSQADRVHDAQTASSDRSSKFSHAQIADNFARLSAQGENGFYRTAVALSAADKQIVQSEVSLGKAVAAGFTDVGATQRDTYARLSEQNCDLKSAIAAAQAAAAECCCEVKQEVLRTGKELGLQAAQNFGAVQVEAAKNTAAVQLQAAVNQKDNFLEQSKWFALTEKTAMLNKCELEAKLAACCCEIKGAVTDTAAATQALIQATENTRVRDSLSAVTTENAILRLRREEHHYYPPRRDSRRGSRS